MATRLVRGACPHDCPDTCAMHVTVEDGRAVKVAGDPDHPITVGFLCGKVSNYLERVYSDERILHPLVREGGDFRRASWDEALDLAAEGPAARARGVRRRVDPALQLHGHAGADPGEHHVGPGDERARRLEPRAHDLRHRRLHRARAMAHGVSPEVDPEEWPNARYLLVWGWNPLSTAPAPVAQAARRAQAGRAARGGRPVPQPHRAGGGRAPAPAARAPTPRSPSG